MPGKAQRPFLPFLFCTFAGFAS